MEYNNDTQHLIASYWDERSAGFDEEHDTEDLALWSDELEKLIAGNGAGTVLDVGTGTGFLAMLAAGLGYETSGVDISGEMLAIGKKKAGLRHLQIRYEQCPCEKLIFEDNSFDAVINCRVMWTLPDPESAVKEWMRVLKPGGRIISFMRMMTMTGGHIEEMYGKAIDLPLLAGDRASYTDVYRKAGLQDIRVIELPQAMSSADMPHWTAFVGIKAKEPSL